MRSFPAHSILLDNPQQSAYTKMAQPVTKHTMSISLVNMKTKILNKILSRRNQQYIQRAINYNQGRFIPAMHRWPL